MSIDPCRAAIAAALAVETGNVLARRRGERELAELSHVLARDVFGFEAIIRDRDESLPRVARFAVLEAVRRHGPPPRRSSPEWEEWVARVSSAARIRMRAFR